MSIAVIAITRNGARLGKKLTQGLAGAQLYVATRYAGQAGSRARHFEPTALRALVSELWEKSYGLIFIMATGIVVRMIAPYLKSKACDPAVIVMDDAGKFAISLLSGHLGGANELAERCAFITGARPVITTATDANELPSFDMLAKQQGWLIEELSRIKLFNSMLLDGEEIAVVDPSGMTRCCFRGRGQLSYHDSFAAAFDSKAKGLLFVTNHYFPPQSIPDNLLILRPCNLVLGIGCNRGTTAEEIDEFVGKQLRRIFLSIKSVAMIATAETNHDEPGLLAYAVQYGIPLKLYTIDELNIVTVPTKPMAVIEAGGAAEPAAVLASGGGRLLLHKVKSTNVTLAVAKIEGDRDEETN